MMTDKTIILLAAMMGFIVLIVIGIIITVIVTGNFLSKGNNRIERPNSNYLLYLKNVERFKCPKCGKDLKLYLGRDNRTYYRCKDMDHCDYMVDPDTLLLKDKK